MLGNRSPIVVVPLITSLILGKYLVAETVGTNERNKGISTV